MFSPEGPSGGTTKPTFQTQAFSIETLVDGYWIREITHRYNSNGQFAQTVERIVVAKDKDDMLDKLAEMASDPITLAESQSNNNNREKKKDDGYTLIGFTQEKNGEHNHV